MSIVHQEKYKMNDCKMMVAVNPSGSAILMSPFANFSCLDELIQVVYQDVNRFVVLSNVSSTEWTIHLGLTGEGRWWRGRWQDADLTKLVVSTPFLRRFNYLLDNSVGL